MVHRQGECCRGCPLLRQQLDRGWTHLNSFWFCPQTDAHHFQDCTIAQRNCLVADLTAVNVAHQRAVQGSTHKNQAQAWRQWLKYDGSTLTLRDLINTNRSSSWVPLLWLWVRDNFLATMTNWLREQSKVPSHLWFQPSWRTEDQTQQKMKIWGLDSFYTDSTEKWCPESSPLKGSTYIKDFKVWKCQNTETEKSLAQLMVAACFFACHSCKYLKIPQDEKRRIDT